MVSDSFIWTIQKKQLVLACPRFLNLISMKNILFKRLLILSVLVMMLSCNHSETHTTDTSEIKVGNFFNRIDGTQISFDSIDASIQQKMQEKIIQGVSIALIDDGKIVYTKAYGVTNSYTQEALNTGHYFEIASLTKPVTAAFAMDLIDEGLIDLDTPLYDYLYNRDIPDSVSGSKLTARMALGHTTGLANWRWQNASNKNEFLSPPGTKFSYSGEAYIYLGDVLGYVSKIPGRHRLDSMVSSRINDPLGIDFQYSMNKKAWENLAFGHFGYKRLVFDSSSYRSQYNAAGGIYGTPRDYAKFLLALSSGKLFPKKLFDQMTQVHTEIFEPERTYESGVKYWGLGFAILPSKYGVNIAHGGNNYGYTNNFCYNLENKTGYVIMTSQDQQKWLIRYIDNLLMPGVQPTLSKYIVRFEVTTDIDSDASVFIAGSQEQLGNFKPDAVVMQQVDKGRWIKEFEFEEGAPIRFKLTLGNWAKQMKNDNGENMEDQSFIVEKDTIIRFKNPRWN